ncbi:MAG: cyclic nucleotide-binding domain-containing protein [Leptospiraceae bacterium]|nr:cyclic nucleotide-binding domain-containing protein [Leptospiraceae bacterium]
MTVKEPLFKLVRFPQGSYITLEGEKRSTSFFIIKEGKISLKRDFVPPGGKKAETLGMGDFFGVISAMSQYPQVESAIALTNSVLISITYNRFSELIQKNTPLALKIIRYFSKMLREFNVATSQGAKTGFISSASDLSLLFSMAENYFQMGNIEYSIYLYQSYLRYMPTGEYRNEAIKKLKELGAALTPPPEQQGLNRHYSGSQMIFSENEPGNDMFIIQRGKIKISKLIDGVDVTLAILNQGDIFGEMALLENKPRSASAISVEPVELLVINRKNFENMVKTQPQLMTRIIVLLSERIWGAYKKLANSMLTDLNGRFADMLLTLAEKNRVKIAPRLEHDYQLNVFDFLKMMGLTDRDALSFQKFTGNNKFIRIERDSIVCHDMALLERLVYSYREGR